MTRIMACRVMEAWKSPLLTSEHPVEPSANASVLAAAITNQILAGDCSVLEWTNTPFGTFPRRFVVNVYNALGDHQRGEKNTLRNKFTGIVTKIGKANAISYVPEIGRPIHTIYDARFRGVERDVMSVRYGPLDHWPTNRSEVDLKKAELLKRVSHSHPPQGLIRAAFLAVLFVGPLIVLMVTIRKKAKKQQAGVSA